MTIVNKEYAFAGQRFLTNKLGVTENLFAFYDDPKDPQPAFYISADSIIRAESILAEFCGAVEQPADKYKYSRVERLPGFIISVEAKP